MLPTLEAFSVGGLSVELPRPEFPWTFHKNDPTPRFFRRKTESAPHSPLRFQIEFDDLGEFNRSPQENKSTSYPNPKEFVFPSPLWGYCHSNGCHWFLNQKSASQQNDLLSVNDKFSEAIIFRNRKITGTLTGFPLQSVVGELFFQLWSPYRNRLLVHGAALCAGKDAILALGHSGDGKSTLSYLWAQSFGEESVLTDERPMIEWKGQKEWLIHGTPWQGSGSFALPECRRLRAIILLRKGETNRLDPVPLKDAFASVLSHSFAPMVSAELAEKVFVIAEQASKALPFYQFTFTRTKNAAQMLAGSFDFST